MSKFIMTLIGTTACLSLLSACNPSEQVQQATASLENRVKAATWGPHDTIAGKPFNVQPSGQSAIWFHVPGLEAGRAYELKFGDTKIEKVVVTKDSGSFELPTQLLEKPGRFPITLVETAKGKSYPIGTFEVKASK